MAECEGLPWGEQWGLMRACASVSPGRHMSSSSRDVEAEDRGEAALWRYFHAPR